VVGCDGGHSAVRKLAGFAFPGTDPLMTVRYAKADTRHPDARNPDARRPDARRPDARRPDARRPDALPPSGRLPGGTLFHDDGMLATFDFTGGPADRDTPLSADEMRESVRRVSGADIDITEFHGGLRFTDQARQAETYRLGRVLLAGDAAHVHSPNGGQGLNLGLMDAMNLGWKLAATVRGTAPAAPRAGAAPQGPASTEADSLWLLDTYHEERHPVGASVLHNTRAQSALLAPGPHVDALRDIFSDLMDLPEVNAYLSRLMSGVAHRYPMPYPVTHPLVGLHCAPGLEGADVLLRPDGVIAWAAEPAAEHDPEGRRTAQVVWGIA
jgi:2-polyprenyl-6-methoxyphenol hydroxylase-like FAD-dependent oxidoreductase